MFFWVILAWAFGFIFTWRRTTWLIAHVEAGRGRKPDGDDVVIGLLVGAILAVPWPAFWLGYAVVMLERNHGAIGRAPYAFMKAPRDQRKKAEKEVGLKEVN